MRRHISRIAAIALASAFAALALPNVAMAASEYGSASRWPWSGYWWPMLNTQTNLYDDGQSMPVYDAYMKNTNRADRARATEWEKANHYTADAKNNWWGKCHAWAAAAILTRQPPASVTRGGVTFTQDNLEGLVTSVYYAPTLNWLSGTRVNTAGDTTSAAYKDIAPAWMDWLLRYYIKYYRYPFIMDTSANEQVWNFPAFAYTRESTANADGSETVTTRVWFSDPKRLTSGTAYWSKLYTYKLKPGTLGEWTGASVLDHPDFAWVPTGKTANNPADPPNPYVTEAVVEEIIGNGYNV